jgi:outer membrane protein OmpA-like peptidoglycan-associated protein
MVKRIARTLSVLALAVAAQTATTEEVRVFTTPPSAEEMGQLLFPDKAGPKTRSLTFTAAQTAQANQEPVAVALPIQFDYNSASLRPEAKSYLDEVGRMLTMDRFAQESLVIEGHTDAKGSEAYNLKLSQRRAQAVKRYLIAQFSIQPERLRTVGQGERKPLPGKDPYDPLNRRVELHRVQ